MARFLVTINATNCILEFNGSHRRLGFFATRAVVSENPELAESAAIEVLRELEELKQKLRNATHDPPLMTLQTIVALPENHASDHDESLAWYAEDDDEEL